MKIDQNRTADTDATTRLNKTDQADLASGTSKTSKVETKQTDRVEMSDDARLMATALDAVKKAPDVRPEAVERARKLLDSGELGKDSLKLADSIIDDLLKKK